MILILAIITEKMTFRICISEYLKDKRELNLVHRIIRYVNELVDRFSISHKKEEAFKL